MKTQITFYFLILTIILGCQKETIKTESINYFQNIENIETQIIVLDTISKKEITGKKGTKIYFNRNSFDINQNDKITLELKEYYSLRELISDNIQTITTKNELLESDGVIYIDFKVNEKSIDLLKNKKLKIEFPKEFKDNYKIFNGAIDTLKQFKWKTNNIITANINLINIDRTLRFNGVIMFNELTTTIDSISFYKNLNIKLIQELEENIEPRNKWQTPSFLLDKLGWINVDKFIEVDKFMNFELILNNTKIKDLTIYLIYNNLNSFTSEFRMNTNLKFYNIPTKGTTDLIVIGRDKTKTIYAEKINLNAQNQSKIELSLKEIDSTKLKLMIQ